MKALLLAIFPLFICGCVSTVHPNDAELEPYIAVSKYWIQAAGLDADRNVIYYFSDNFADINNIGKCVYFPVLFVPSVITIRRSWWLKHTSENDRLLLVLHEVAHCFLDADHVDSKTDLMYPNIVYGMDPYTSFRDVLLRQGGK